MLVFGRPRYLASLGLCAALVASAVPRSAADGPPDNSSEKVRQVPPKGVAVPPADAAELKAGLADIKKELDALPEALKDKPALLDLIPDVEIYYTAVRYALDYDEFFNAKEIPAAKALLKQGIARAKDLKEGKSPWTTATGLVVRGYRSKIDGSAQPYGLVVPKNYDPKAATKHRLDFWWHGRGENLSEVNFIDGRQKSSGDFTPVGAFVLHPYGRYCNANKFAGEIDTLECLAHAKKHYPIDDSRIVARGFSMGGAACWQFAVHYPTLFCAAAPGAGFSETPEFLHVFQHEKVEPTWYEKKLWHMYNASDCAQNIFDLPTVAYSGEVDSQKQAADVMAREMKKVGLELTHLIGPKTGHSYHPETKKEVIAKVDAIVAKGRDPFPKEIKFVTYTLLYNKCAWVTVTGLGKHWEAAHVNGEVKNGVATLTTENVTRLQVDFKQDAGHVVSRLAIDGTEFTLPAADAGAYIGRFHKAAGKWESGSGVSDGVLVKKHGLQGPIDDAFMDKFLMVKPTGTPLNEKVGAWAATEFGHAVAHWRKQFRGDAPVKDDTAVTDDDIAHANLVLWGDPGSNKVLAKIADKLPVKWTKDGLTVGDKTYDGKTHAAVLIYPNPLNPKKYVVLNSGFTFREYDYLNNARQVPKLPDYAVVDVTSPPTPRVPGKIVRAGFFGEAWDLRPDDGQ
ncbi:prolyl oligopeptidase family serine peptidase [Fimbriiglobus ruber]|uniref:Peptidase S9 prolyl oligopeptidase catalytic domain-containing protein n=1 Tax=Fimbriiglobus ruber TaxID=1908690 RepID=A0A225DWC9_9BACT|nr:prolyl oligopeptidase family serine peptidase [Fimbriiglobus ruber]OWK40615.1 hypothetical protein FRUB_05534 [Fimbriiglobus ruber]